MRHVAPWLLVTIVLLPSVACKRQSLSREGSYVRLVTQTPAGCEELGEVQGKGGGTLTDPYYKKKVLREDAIKAARNKAAQIGATHVLLNEPRQGTGVEAGSTTFTVKGIAYRCKAGASSPWGTVPTETAPLEEESKPSQEQGPPNRNTGAGSFQ